MKRFATNFFCLLMLLSLSCACTTQTVKIDDVFVRLLEEPIEFSSPKAVAVQIQNNADPSTNEFIEEADIIQETLYDEIVKALEKYGFSSPGRRGTGSPRLLSVTIDSLVSKAEQRGHTHYLTYELHLNVYVHADGVSYQNTYLSSQVKDFLSEPKDKHHLQMANHMLSNALSMMLSDEELIEFLARDKEQ